MRSATAIGVCFLLLSIVLASAALAYGSWCYLLLYPAVSFATVAIGYLGLGQRVFGKGADGRRHWLAWLVLWPYLVLASVTWHIIRLVSREPPLDEMDDDIWLSRRLLPNELPSHVNSVVDLTCELSEPSSIRQARHYRGFPMLDAVGADPDVLMALGEEILQMPRPVLIHCAQGHGRTGLVAAVVLLLSRSARSAENALEIIKLVRPGAGLSRSQIQTLEAVHKKLAALRFDGIYSAFDGAMYRHLRFFENGNKVAFLLIGLDAEEVAKGLNEEFQARCGGTFQVDEQTVSFIITDKGFGKRNDVVVEYRGEICIDSLMLDIYSHTTQHRSSERFYFFPVEF